MPSGGLRGIRSIDANLRSRRLRHCMSWRALVPLTITLLLAAACSSASAPAPSPEWIPTGTPTPTPVTPTPTSIPTPTPVPTATPTPTPTVTPTPIPTSTPTLTPTPVSCFENRQELLDSLNTAKDELRGMEAAAAQLHLLPESLRESEIEGLQETRTRIAELESTIAEGDKLNEHPACAIFRPTPTPSPTPTLTPTPTPVPTPTPTPQGGLWVGKAIEFYVPDADRTVKHEETGERVIAYFLENYQVLWIGIWPSLPTNGSCMIVARAAQNWVCSVGDSDLTYDKVTDFIDHAAPAPTATPTPTLGSWEPFSSTDPLTRERRQGMRVQAVWSDTDHVFAWRIGLYLFCDGSTPGGYVHWGQPMTAGAVGTFRASYSVDGGAVHDVRWGALNDGEGTWISETRSFANDIRSSSEVVVRTWERDGNFVTARFPTTGARRALGELPCFG